MAAGDADAAGTRPQSRSSPMQTLGLIGRMIARLGLQNYFELSECKT
jgi:hypothetical protein